MFLQADEALADSLFLELRFDSLKQHEEACCTLQTFCATHPEATVLATCRRVEGGGAFVGSVAEQLALLVRFASCGARIVDVELETLEVTPPAELAAFHAALQPFGAHVLVSAHDFRRTGDLELTLKRLRSLGMPCHPAIYKVVSTAERLRDNLRLLEFIGAASHEVPIVGICMGEAGFVSRVLAIGAGGLFTFASATGGQPTAAGQVSARLLLDEYRVAQLTYTPGGGSSRNQTRIYGVAGNPVTHSLSPAIHNAGFRAAGKDAVSLPIHTTAIDDLVELTRGLPLSGLSVTMPWKIEILPFLDVTDPLAGRIGAVNTVHPDGEGRLFGTNTDAAAIAEPLREQLASQGVALRGARVLLLGAGGAARAAAFALQAEGAQLFIQNRTRSTAEALAKASGAKVAEPGPVADADHADESDETNGHHEPGRHERETGAASDRVLYDVVVHATPAGMLGQEQALPVLAASMQSVRVLFEMVYRPSETPLTRLAERLGIAVIYGQEMFLRQGIRQWELWRGQPAPVDAMRQALDKALAAAESANAP